MYWNLSSNDNKGSLHTAVRTLMLKQSQSMGLFASKISLSVVRLREIRYGRSHSLLKRIRTKNELVDHILVLAYMQLTGKKYYPKHSSSSIDQMVFLLF